LKIKSLKYPHPYKAWLVLANDPDHTTYERWLKLHQFIWEELQLPFSDSLFTFSYNQYLPGQANLADHGEKMLMHSYDTLHSWGDFRHTGDKAFNRSDAEKASKILKEMGIKARVWTDHSSFIGNYMHNSQIGSVKTTKDASGYTYVNQQYSLDLAYDLGVRYIWDGKLHLKVVNRIRYQNNKIKLCFLKCMGKLISKVFPEFSSKIDKNKDLEKIPYKRQKFPDGREFYIFRRFGSWRYSDIDGLHRVLNNENLDQLVSKQGIRILYTHLGKRRQEENHDSFIIPESAKEALLELKSRYQRKEILLSSVSEVLDYCVLRDHLKISVSKKEIEWKADGIRFNKIQDEDLIGKSFSFYTGNNDFDYKIITHTNCNHQIVKETKSIYTIKFI